MPNAWRMNDATTCTTKVDFTAPAFTPREIRYEVPALLASPDVKVLHLPVNRLDGASAKCIAMMLENDAFGPQIEELHLSDTQRCSDASDDGASHDGKSSFTRIASSLKCSSVKKLVLSETPVDHSQISALASMLYDVQSLKTLVVRQCGLDHRAATKISCALASNKSVESFDFSNNPLGNRGIASLAVALEINTTLKKLKLSGTHTGIEGAVAISQAIKSSNSSIEVLDLSRNAFGDMGASKLAIALKSNKVIRQLSLRQTQLSDVGALCILLSLYDDKSLQSIINCNHAVRYINLSSNDEVTKKCLLDIEAARTMNLQPTELETVREKVAFFLNEESNTSYFGDEASGDGIALKCMPNLLSAIGSTGKVTALYNVVRNVHMPALYESKPCVSADSLFSNDENDATDHKKKDAVPAFIQIDSCANDDSP
ncbi:hypothetical protein ACHAXT_010264 [Thalassiosira profunda]